MQNAETPAGFAAVFGAGYPPQKTERYPWPKESENLQTVFRDVEAHGGPIMCTLWLSRHQLYIRVVPSDGRGRDRFFFEVNFVFWDPWPTTEKGAVTVTLTGTELVSYTLFQGAVLGQTGRLVRCREVEELKNIALAWRSVVENALDAAGSVHGTAPVPMATDHRDIGPSAALPTGCAAPSPLS
jgi:hypothetical protein